MLSACRRPWFAVAWVETQTPSSSGLTRMQDDRRHTIDGRLRLLLVVEVHTSCPAQWLRPGRPAAENIATPALHSSQPQLLKWPRTCLSPMMGSRPVPDRLPAVCVARNFSAATSLDGRQRDSASALRSGLSARLGGRAGAQRAATPGLRAHPVRV